MKHTNIQTINATANTTITIDSVNAKIASNQASLERDVRYHFVASGARFDDNDVMDVVSVVNEKALRAAGRYSSEKGAVRTYMNKIAYHEVADYLKARTRTSLKCLDAAADVCDSEPYTENSIGNLHCIQQAIASLKDRDRSVVRMLLRKASGREMAAELGISEGAQRKLVLDVRQRLSKKLSELHYYDMDECA